MISNITFDTAKVQKKVELPENLVFGKTFTTHMFEMDYDIAKGGWVNPTIKEYSKFEISPACMTFHYAQSIFEGLKAYKHENGKIAMFRPEKNIERLNNSCRRMCIPEIDPDFLLNAMKELIKIDQEWIPTKPGYSLYIRPFIFANDAVLGVRPADTYKCFIILSPVGPYYPEGFKPVPILATDEYVRAVRKGVGDCKTSGNYAASLYAQREAKKQGFTQVLWLDGVEQKYIEEVGTMNIFIRFKNEVVTPKLTGSILPGVTRMSVIQVLKDWGYNIVERQVELKEVLEGYKNGELIEMFGSGTAAVISSVGKLKYKDEVLDLGSTEVGELSQKLYNELSGIQNGKVEDKYNWLTYID